MNTPAPAVLFSSRFFSILQRRILLSLIFANLTDLFEGGKTTGQIPT